MKKLEKLHNALNAAGVKPYLSMYRSSAKAEAQDQLSGRTHYADDSTLRFFNARINECRHDEENGLWFALRESVDYPGANRVHRWAVFDVFGNCDRTDNAPTGAAADKLLPDLLARNWSKHTTDQLKQKARRMREEASRITAALNGKGCGQ